MGIEKREKLLRVDLDEVARFDGAKVKINLLESIVFLVTSFCLVTL